MNAQSGSRPAGWIAGFLGASAVALGAFGAHALQSRIPAEALEIWRTAVQYHFWHALAFALAAIMFPRSRAAKWAMGFFGAGVLLFCGSLYALALGAARWVGALTPLGGVCLILGWIALGAASSGADKWKMD